MRRNLLSLLIATSYVVGCNTLPSAPSQETAGQETRPNEIKPSRIMQLARDTLAGIQVASLSKNIEYCGYIVSIPDGSLKIVGPAPGSTFGCRTPLVYKPDVILASFHTHGAFDTRTLTETPSSIDFDAVASERVDAFIGTPGGRFWLLDSKTATAKLLCGPKDCLPRQLPTPKELDDPVPDTLMRPQVLEIERENSSLQLR